MSRFLPYSASHPRDTSAGEELLWATILGYVFVLFYAAVALAALVIYVAFDVAYWKSFVTALVAAIVPHFLHAKISGAHQHSAEYVPGIRTHRFAAVLSNYFEAEFILEDDAVDLDPHFKPGVVREGAELPPSPQFIFGLHPHGIHCVSALLFGYNHGPLANLFPRGLQLLFYLPFAREMALGYGLRSVEKGVCDTVLQEGNSLMIVPGGAAEMIETETGTDRVFLKHRRGFVRLALRHRVPLVPCYGFGVNDLYHIYPCIISCRSMLEYHVSNLGRRNRACSRSVGGSFAESAYSSSAILDGGALGFLSADALLRLLGDQFLSRMTFPPETRVRRTIDLPHPNLELPFPFRVLLNVFASQE